MKKTITMLALSLAVASGSAFAGDSYYDTATVIKAKPIYENIRVNEPVSVAGTSLFATAKAVAAAPIRHPSPAPLLAV